MVLNRFKRCLAALSMLAITPLIAAPAHASVSNMFGLVIGVYGTYSGAVLFSVVSIDGNHPYSRTGGIPSCGSANPNRWALDASTVAGQAQVQVLMTAYTQHKPIYVTGTGTCTIWGDTETVSFFNLADP